MSDDLDRRLRESLGDLPLPEAPRTLHDAADRLEAEPVAPRTRARRLIPAAVAVLVVASAATAVLIGGSSLPHIGVSSSPKASQPPGGLSPLAPTN